MELHSTVPKSHNRTAYLENRTLIWREREAVSAPQSHGLDVGNPVAAGCSCQKRCRIERMFGSNWGEQKINSARVQNMALRSNAQTFQNRTVYLKIQQKHGEKQKRHQRHNLAVLSTLPVARSGAVG